jgi:hypothetical protein
MSKRHGRNTRRKMRKLEERVATNLRTHMYLEERMREVQRNNPSVVTCQVMDNVNSIYRPGKDNVRAEIIETIVSPPRIALRSEVGMELSPKHFDSIAAKIKHSINLEMDSQLRACFAELVAKI